MNNIQYNIKEKYIKMPLTSHDGVFGWIHGFKINQNNIIFGTPQIARTPYPPIIRNPSIKQTFQAWNFADTSMMGTVIFVTSLTAGSLIRAFGENPFSEMMMIQLYRRIISLSITFGFCFAFRNAFYRLEGLVPNGLPLKEVHSPVKFDYTTE
jgi:hypothetical protein